jgi:hypothetical protein
MPRGFAAPQPKQELVGLGVSSMFLFPFRLWLQKKLQIPRFAPFVSQGKRDDSVKTKAKPQTRTKSRNQKQKSRRDAGGTKTGYNNLGPKLGAKT